MTIEDKLGALADLDPQREVAVLRADRLPT
jgi:hypothetical protein